MPLPFTNEEIDIITGQDKSIQSKADVINNDRQKTSYFVEDRFMTDSARGYKYKMKYAEDVDDDIIAETPDLTDNESSKDKHITVDPKSADPKSTIHITEVADDTQGSSMDRVKNQLSAHKTEEDNTSNMDTEEIGHRSGGKDHYRGHIVEYNQTERAKDLILVRKDLENELNQDIIDLKPEQTNKATVSLKFVTIIKTIPIVSMFMLLDSETDQDGFMATLEG